MSQEHVSDQEVEGALSEDEVSPPVAEKLHDAKDAHRDQAADPGASEGQGVESGLMGYAEPDTGLGEAAESEIPVGVDSLTDEQIQAAEERGGSGGGDDDGGGEALDVSALMQEGGAADETEGGAADETGEGAPVMTDPEAQVAPNTDEEA